ncbi:hypothetical protein CEXT_182451, partial [Caerostris extrusa]
SSESRLGEEEEEQPGREREREISESGVLEKEECSTGTGSEPRRSSGRVLSATAASSNSISSCFFGRGREEVHPYPVL